MYYKKHSFGTMYLIFVGFSSAPMCHFIIKIYSVALNATSFVALDMSHLHSVLFHYNDIILVEMVGICVCAMRITAFDWWFELSVIGCDAFVNDVGNHIRCLDSSNNTILNGKIGSNRSLLISIISTNKQIKFIHKRWQSDAIREWNKQKKKDCR